MPVHGRWQLLLALVVLAGCHSEPEQLVAGSEGQLVDLPWVLISGLEAPGFQEHPPTARFSGGSMTGSTGCNLYNARYTLDGDALRVKLQSTTLMACEPPKAAVEAEFTEKLERVAAWHVQDDELVLANDDGGELLRFNVPSLSGNWEAFSTYQGTSVSSLLEGTEITASFADGTLTGSAGCNTYRATYESGRGTLKISPPAGTRMSCPEPAGVMKQEQTYLAALPEVARYSLEGDQLYLLRADGTIVAIYERRP